MSDVRLKSKMFVQALLRRCDMAGTAAYIMAAGDGDAGAIFVKVVKADRSVLILSPAHTDDGDRRWRSQDYPSEGLADAFLGRQRGYDPDLWIVEIESRDGAHPLNDSLVKD